MASFGSAGRFGGRVKSKAIAARRKLSAADEKKVRSKLKAAAYTAGGVDWHRLFSFYDRDNSGEIGYIEFKRLLRSDAKIPVSQLSDADVKSLFNSVDTDGSGEIDADEFIVWVQGDDNNYNSTTVDQSSPRSSRGRSRASSSGYGKTSPSELSSPSQRRFDVEKGWLNNNYEHSEAEGALIAHQESGKDRTNQNYDKDDDFTNVPRVSPNSIKRAAAVLPSSSSSVKSGRSSSRNRRQMDYMDDKDDRIHHSAQRAIDEAESSLANSNRVNLLRLSSPPSSGRRSKHVSIDTEASIDALLQLQREKEQLEQKMRRLETDTKRKDDALEQAAATVVGLQTSAEQSDHQADAWHRVVEDQKMQLQRILDDSSEKEQTIQMQAEQLRALKILVEARASSSSPSKLSSASSNISASPVSSSSPYSSSIHGGATTTMASSFSPSFGDGNNDLVAQLRSKMNYMDETMRSTAFSSHSPTLLSSPPMQQRQFSLSSSSLSSSPTASTISTFTRRSPKEVNRTDTSGLTAMTYTEIELNNTKNELKESKHAYNVASKQASSLSVEKIELEKKLYDTTRQLSSMEKQLKEKQHDFDKEINELQQELRSTLSRNVSIQREMVSKLTASEHERSLLLQRVQVAEENVHNSASAKKNPKEIDNLRIELETMYQNHEKSIQLEKELRSEIKSLHEKLQASLTQSTKKMNGLKTERDRLQSSNDMLNTKYKTLEMETDELKKDLQHMKEELSKIKNNDNNNNKTDEINNVFVPESTSERMGLLTDNAEVEHLKLLVTELSKKNANLVKEKELHVTKLHSEMENLEKELEHVHAMHDEKHKELLRLKDVGGGSSDTDDDVAHNDLDVVYSVAY